MTGRYENLQLLGLQFSSFSQCTETAGVSPAGTQLARPS